MPSKRTEVNYLAHLYLSGDDRELLLGNFMGDFVKGPNLSHLPPGVARGVRLHRRIDAFTDYHPIVQRSLARLSERWGWYSGVLLDVFHDYFLATDWECYHAHSLRAFVDEVHGILLSALADMPPTVRTVVERMISDDRLYTYQRRDGIEQTLVRLSERLRRHQVRLEAAMADLTAHEAALRADFHAFFPEVIAHVREVQL